jgi:hypothetical protein
MKIRILSIACVTAAVALLAACTAPFRNSDTCEQLMRSKLADTSSDTLNVAHRGAAIRGSRVVIEGTIEHVTTASEATAAAPPPAHAAAATNAASAARALPGASGVDVASAASAVSVGAAGDAGASEAAATLAASAAKALPAKPATPKPVVMAAAAECTFNGEELNVFRWLAPAKFVTPAN